jgi:hypothetical protein
VVTPVVLPDFLIAGEFTHIEPREQRRHQGHRVRGLSEFCDPLAASSGVPAIAGIHHLVLHRAESRRNVAATAVLLI